MAGTFFDRWWTGRRGEWYVIIQTALFALIAFGPRNWPGGPVPPFSLLRVGSTVGVVLFLAGGLLAAGGAIKLGKNLSPLPYPKKDAELIEKGPYRIVRHPIYSGVILMAFGWALWVHGCLSIGYAIILLLFLDVKASREEQWLLDKYPGYADYQKRVRKLIPFIY